MKMTNVSNVDNWAESVSALMDGESDAPEQAIDRLNQDVAAKLKWQRYHSIRDAIQGRACMPVKKDLSDRIMLALQAEPAILAPANLRTRGNRISKPFLGVGIAAAVASLTFYALQQNVASNASTPQSGVQTVAAETEKMVERPRVVSLQQTAEYPAGQKHTNEQLEKALDGYLIDHAGYSAVSNMHGMVPYVRVAGYDADHQ